MLALANVPRCYHDGAMCLLPSRFLLILAIACTSWMVPAIAQDQGSFSAVDLDAALSLDTLAGQLASKRVVFVGETHDRYGDHLNQLEIIRSLHQLDPNWVIGVEYFQQPFQTKVDDYIAGRSTEQEFLRDTHYYQNWGYDYRLYAPIFRFAREQRIPVRALNVPGSLPSTVAKLGMAGLSGQQRAYLPKDIAPADASYRSRLREAFEEHGPAKPDAFNHFVEAQLVWDEGMAQSAAEYLNANPGRRMVILAGSGHLAFGSGIPQRMERRAHATYAIVLNSGEEIGPHVADYILLTPKQELPPAGVLGVTLQEKAGVCRIGSLVPGGAAAKAGLKRKDVLLEIDDQKISTIADMRLALWDKKPGDRVRLSVRRPRHFGGASTLSFAVELAKPGKA
jgi:uncharacterized iron-regulated protein